MSTLSDYVAKAKTTAQPEAYSYDYLIPGLLGEVGEVFGQLAKAHWHGWTPAKLEEELVAEYGDICWMTAIMMDKRFGSDLPAVDAHTDLDGFLPFYGMRRIAYILDQLVVTLLSEEAMEESEAHESYRQVADNALVRLWQALEEHAPVVTGHPIQKALDYNAAKLASRAERGVLRGAGDHR